MLKNQHKKQQNNHAQIQRGAQGDQTVPWKITSSISFQSNWQLDLPWKKVGPPWKMLDPPPPWKIMAWTNLGRWEIIRTWPTGAWSSVFISPLCLKTKISQCYYVVMTWSLLRNDIMRFSVLGFISDIRVELQAPVHDLKIVDWDVNKMLGVQWLTGRVFDTRPKGCGFEPHRRPCVVSLSKNINPSLVLVQPRKICPYITERLLMGLKESNQTNKQIIPTWPKDFWLGCKQNVKKHNNADMAVHTCSILYEVTDSMKVLNCVSLKLSLACGVQFYILQRIYSICIYNNNLKWIIQILRLQVCTLCKLKAVKINCISM